jgi:hypothetical protein
MRECKIKASAVKGRRAHKKWLTASCGSGAEIFTHHGEKSSHQPGNCHNGVVYERERYDFAFVGSLEPFWPQRNGPIMTFASAALFCADSPGHFHPAQYESH